MCGLWILFGSILSNNCHGKERLNSQNSIVQNKILYCEIKKYINTNAD